VNKLKIIYPILAMKRSGKLSRRMDGSWGILKKW
jgi:hypothetical protein